MNNRIMWRIDNNDTLVILPEGEIENRSTKNENCNFTIKLFNDGKLMQSFDIITNDSQEDWY